MAVINGRRAHWRATHADAEDESFEAHRCFTHAPDAGEWLTEQLHGRKVSDIGGLDDLIETTDWLRCMTGSIDTDGDDPGGAGRWWRTVGGVVYRVAGCVCGEDVTGRCSNGGCDRDTSWDSEPGGDYPGYCGWGHACGRCFGLVSASGGFSHEGRPIPKHGCVNDHTAARVRKLIEGDEHVGWWCAEYHRAASDDPKRVEWEQCGRTWRFDDPAMAWRWRLTRAWDGEVTGTQGWALTLPEANAEAARLNERSAVEGWGFTVDVEPVNSDER